MLLLHTVLTQSQKTCWTRAKVSSANPVKNKYWDALYQSMDTHAAVHPKFSFWVGVCFTLNYVVGSGFLTLPWAFQQTGALLGVTILAIFVYFSILATWFILESMVRAARVLEYQARDVELSNRGTNRQGYASISTTTNELRDIKDNDMTISDSSSHSLGRSPLHATTNDNRRIELTELCELFLGPTCRRCFSFVIGIYMYGTLWAYCAVFSKAFAVQFALHGEVHPEEGSTYYVYLFVFACLVVPLSLMELSEQIYIQVSLTILRGVLLSLMLITTSIAYASCGTEFGDLSSTSCKASTDATHTANSLYESHFNKIYLFLPIAAYAYIFHHSVPGLSEPVEDKKSLVKLYTVALLISFVGYALLGVVVSAYFGANTLSSSNLNWRHFEGLRNADGSIPHYAHIVSGFVILFPALDVASAYPLNAFTLGNNLMAAYYGEEMMHHERSRFKTSIFRLLSAVPPFIGAACVSELSHITAFTGLTGFAIAFVVPALLAYSSAKRMQELDLPVKTIHSSGYTSEQAQWVLGGSGVLLIVVVVTCQILFGTD